MSDLKQMELDAFEAELLMRRFGRTNLTHIEATFIKQATGKSPQELINAFEAVTKPTMDDTGQINKQKFVSAIGEYFPQVKPFLEFLPPGKSHFRLMDLLDIEEIINIIGV